MSTPPRPTADHAIILAAAQKICPEHANTIARHYHYPMDGYELCRELDRYASWDCTREDVDTFDKMDWEVSRLVRAAEKDWFLAHNIKPALAIGTRVSLRHGRAAAGTITGVYEHGHGYYLVKADDQVDTPESTRRHLIKFEEAKLIAGTGAA